MHTLIRGAICSLALSLTGVSAWVYFSEYVSPDASMAGASTLFGEASPATREGLTAGGHLDLSARVLARSKMSPQVAALAAAGDRRLLRLEVQGEARDLNALGGALVSAAGEGDGAVVDLPGRALDRFALQTTVQRVSLLGIVTR
ncbi:MAG: hypothetical protein AAF184_23950 [Pseudomonadota bacterium]